ncbi:LacI family DNA-binding transcriptional regulator [Microterricola viridarii]|uniref:LacI family transcriptional regulator n=1 Tax=Microterricola viridarii TaxID=412690 RepID=A0A0Y0NJ34_9MICO|nr:LacI family DNA-binding transcriptional regulator [Microterricola viridarii]AMB59755.1 LacI family transcriptional regulator [Microterricola viridarii]
MNPATGNTPVPTLEMVAAHAGVSRATVSRVVNGSPTVASDIVESVNKAIAELNYVPNRAARMLASRRTQVIALIVPESSAKIFADPFFAQLVQGVGMHLAETEYMLNMLIESEANSGKTRRYLLGGNVDGALVVSHHSGDHSYAQLNGTLPVVYGGRPLVAEEGDTFYVDVDNRGGAASATTHLIDIGRRHIATIAGPLDMPPGFDRLDGWRSVMREQGLDDSLVEQGDFTVPSGAEAMRRLLQREPGIDAVFAANDQMAVGAYQALAEAGRQVPADVAVIGFDDNSFAETATPALTTVRQPAVGMGQAMAELLVQIIEGQPHQEHLVLPTTFVRRASA